MRSSQWHVLCALIEMHYITNIVVIICWNVLISSDLAWHSDRL